MWYAVEHVGENAWAGNGLHVDTLHIFETKKTRDYEVAKWSALEAVTREKAKRLWYDNDHMDCLDWTSYEARFKHRPPWDPWQSIYADDEVLSDGGLAHAIQGATCV